MLGVIAKHYDANEAYLETHIKRVNGVLRLTIVVGLLVAGWVGFVGALNVLQEPGGSMQMEEAGEPQVPVGPNRGEEATLPVVDAE